MSFADDLAAAKAAAARPILVDVALNDVLYQVECSRLPGMDWAGVVASSPPTDEGGARLGYDTAKGALMACERHGRLLDADGEPVDDVDWRALFDAISGVEAQAVAATWWALNMADPNQNVEQVKKVSRGGRKTSSS